jgi:CubicO group peptidase (beta-lactamase class C family)
MSTGHAGDTTEAMRGGADANWACAFLALAGGARAGLAVRVQQRRHLMLSAIVQKVTGQKVIDFLRPRLFKPLGITDPEWEECPRGINTGGWGLSIHTYDIARFGQLYLQKGQWQGRQLVPAEWVAEATAWHIANNSQLADWRQGYGYQFWRCRHNAFRADVAFGQFCVVMPEQDAVLAMNDGTSDLQGVLDLAWSTCSRL